MLKEQKFAVLIWLVLGLTGCSAGSKQGAASGAKQGGVGGLVAGAVGSIFWGGDAVNNALRTAAVGAASGAAVGAMNGAEREKRQGNPPVPAPLPGQGPSAQAAGTPVTDQALRAQMGDTNFAAGEELARCRHVSAIAKAEKAFATETDPKRKAYALLIEAMAAEESSNSAKANAVYAQWGELDPARADAAKARNDALDGILKLQKVRQDHGLPALCT